MYFKYINNNNQSRSPSAPEESVKIPQEGG